jgi:MFS family permease
MEDDIAKHNQALASRTPASFCSAPSSSPPSPCLLLSSPFLLLCVSLLVLGVALSQDFPGSMYSFLVARFGADSFAETENQVLYSVYSWPNAVLVAVAGFAMDGPVGVHNGTLLCALVAFVGQMMFSAALQGRSYPWAVVSRFVFGLGAESLKVAQNTWIVRLSDSKDMAFRFGVVLSVSRLASASNFALMPTVGEQAPEVAIWIGTATSAIAMAAAGWLVRGDREKETHEHAASTEQGAGENKKMKAKKQQQQQQQPPPEADPAAEPLQATSTSLPPQQPLSRYIDVVADPVTNGTDTVNSPVLPVALTSTSISASPCPSLHVRRAFASIRTTLRSFSIQVWLQLALCMFYHVGVLLLLQVGARYLVHASALRSNARAASLLVSIPVFIGIVGIPAAGRVADKFGHALASIFGACVLLVCAELLLIAYLQEWVASDSASGWALVSVAWVLVGISYAVATASIWPLVPFLMPPTQIATCYGAMTSIENLGLAILSLLLPYVEREPLLRDTHWQYTLPLLLLMLCGVIAGGLAAVQLYVDRVYHGGRLSRPAALRKG